MSQGAADREKPVDARPRERMNDIGARMQERDWDHFTGSTAFLNRIVNGNGTLKILGEVRRVQS